MSAAPVDAVTRQDVADRAAALNDRRAGAPKHAEEAAERFMAQELAAIAAEELQVQEICGAIGHVFKVSTSRPVFTARAIRARCCVMCEKLEEVDHA